MSSFQQLQRAIPITSLFTSCKQMPMHYQKWSTLGFLTLFIVFFVLAVIAMEQYSCLPVDEKQNQNNRDSQLYSATLGFAIIIIVIILVFTIHRFKDLHCSHLMQKPTVAYVLKFVLILSILLDTSILLIAPVLTTVFIAQINNDIDPEQICNPQTNELNYRTPTIVFGSIILFVLFVELIMLWLPFVKK